MANDWTREEVELAVSDYLEMLEMEISGNPFNKAERNRNLRRFLKDRTRGSIERKHQNISAVLVKLGFPYVDGYKPLHNHQTILLDVVCERLRKAIDLQHQVEESVLLPVHSLPNIQDWSSVLDARPPIHEEAHQVLRDSPRPTQVFPNKNYLAVEAANRSLGEAGEDFVMRFEHERLWRAGKRNLAERIDQVSKSKGDHIGFDIHSFETTGEDKLIEVKTTRFGPLTPFFATRNEVEVSERLSSTYQVYRLYRFSTNARLFVLHGSVRTSCDLEPTHYSALPR